MFAAVPLSKAQAWIAAKAFLLKGLPTVVDAEEGTNEAKSKVLTPAEGDLWLLSLMKAALSSSPVIPVLGGRFSPLILNRMLRHCATGRNKAGFLTDMVQWLTHSHPPAPSPFTWLSSTCPLGWGWGVYQPHM